MEGGEIFIPKIPSVNIVDVARAINRKKPIKFVGIRPGEKLHEVMCSTDESKYVLIFKDHILILPTIQTFGSREKLKLRNKMINPLNEKGKKANKLFEYNSKNNVFLNVNQIYKKLIDYGFKI